MNPHRQQKGFSLVELIIVIAVMSILIGMSGYALSTLSSTSLSTSTREVADFMNLCRSHAISQHTVVRFGIVTELKDPQSDPDAPYRAYSSWSWNKIRKQYEQSSRWRQLPSDVVFEPEPDHFIRDAEYARDDASSVRGDHFVDQYERGKEFVVDSPNGRAEVRFMEFTSSGRARVPTGEKRNILLVLKPGNRGPSAPENWAQLNIDRFTGRVRTYRP
ncbi:MAG: prepilin-type N-terminal cleavage/methylation domain-containing protein [Verrucomicrobiales bacterium]|nr:prepilin-type N-terminal cleavage/methylation domain-containing protein [Verrucomicrobiales bacterium]